MGLRIIDRKPKPNKLLGPAPTPGERDAQLRAAADQWGHAIGGDQEQRQEEFLEKIRSIRSRLTTNTEAKSVAADIENRLRNLMNDPTKMQGTIDPDTLLELL